MFIKPKAGAIALVASAALVVVQASPAAAKPFLKRLGPIRTLASMVPTSGPAKGDQNPYGVSVVPTTAGKLVKGDVLVSNFNDKNNHQGTGSSIVEVSPAGKTSVFAVVPRPTSTHAVGLTTALVTLRSGFVIVGSLPAPGGNSSAARSGALTVLDASGHVVSTITAPDINGPWDMTALDGGSTATLFVTNVLNGTVAARGRVVHKGTVVRLTLSIPAGGSPQVTSNQVIASGFAERTDPNALIIGPTGVGLGAGGVLYVADSARSRIAAVPEALTRTTALGGGGVTVTSGKAINDPLGLAIAPNGDVITVNGADGNAVETTPGGRQIATRTLVANGAGDLFGLAIAPNNNGIYFVDDAGSGRAANSLELLR